MPAINTLNSITGIDQIKNRKKLSGCPSRWASPATITLADAPISVPLPPKQAPNESAHHTGIMASRPPIVGSMVLSIGIMVATNGMLSIALESTADEPKIKNTLLGYISVFVNDWHDKFN